MITVWFGFSFEGSSRDTQSSLVNLIPLFASYVIDSIYNKIVVSALNSDYNSRHLDRQTLLITPLESFISIINQHYQN